MNAQGNRTRIVLALLCATLFSVGAVYADGFAVSGTIETIETGPIFVSIYDEASFAEEVPLDGVIVQPEEGVAVFLFDGLESGVYCIRCFQDLNGNEVLDFGRFGPSEPYGFFRESTIMGRPPRFDEISFDLTEDIAEILIEI